MPDKTDAAITSAKAPARIVAGAIGTAITSVSAGTGWWLGGTFGMFLPAVGALISACIVAAFLVVNERYLRILGHSGRKNDAALQAYEELRAHLAAGGNFAKIYATRLDQTLKHVERFFGDSGHGRRIWAHDVWGGLRETPALWTAPSYDRCLLLALLYPVTAIIFVWATGNHVGPAEAALDLRTDSPWLKFHLPFILLTLPVTSWYFTKSSERTKPYWRAAFLATIASTIATAIVFGGASTVAFAGLIAAAGTSAIARAHRSVGAVAVVMATVVATVIAAANYDIVAFASAGVGAFLLLTCFERLNGLAIQRERQAGFLTALTCILTLLCFAFPYWLAVNGHWAETGAPLLLLCLLPLANAVFDWLSLGLTRLLLNLGLQWQRWWPIGFALIDAACAVIFIYGLTFVMVLSVQTFDTIASLGGGHPILPLDKFLFGLRETPGAYDHWWIYALLITTLFPSAMNLAVGGFSLLRGIPSLNNWMLTRMPGGKPVPPFNRIAIALLLTGQIFGGIAAGIIAQSAIAIGTIFWLLPTIGASLLDSAQSLAIANLPARLLF